MPAADRLQRPLVPGIVGIILLPKMHKKTPFSALGAFCTLTRSGGVQNLVPFPVPFPLAPIRLSL